ncbi:acetyl-CoA carboxylase 1-like protein [Tanacetum coccineum]
MIPLYIPKPQAVCLYSNASLHTLLNKGGGGKISISWVLPAGVRWMVFALHDYEAEHPITEWTAESQKLIYTQHKLRLEWAFLFGKFRNSGRYDAWRATSVNATPFICEKTESIRPKGHCVVVRVTIRDPDDGFKPNGGKVQELSFKRKPNVRAYFFVKVIDTSTKGLLMQKLDKIKGSHNWDDKIFVC